MSEQQKASNIISKIEEETKCTICTGLYYDPHLLNCGHSFCGSCILLWFQQKKCCPKCRVPAIRQPVPIIALQDICDLLRPENVILDKKLTRADWEVLYPVENQSSYIRDQDQDGVIHRCSNCGWELDEENYCGNCMIHYDNGSIVNDNESDYNLQSDAGSNMDPEEDLEDFIVDDGQVEFEDVIDDSILDEDEEMEPVVRNNRKRRRIINLSDDDEDDNNHNNNSELISIPDDDDEDEDNDNSDIEMIHSYGDEGDHSQEEEIDSEEEEYPDDVFHRRPTQRSVYIDDFASEDEEEEEDTRPKRVDNVLDSITKAKNKMKQQQQATSSTTVISSSSSSSPSSSSSSDDDEPDYNL